MARPIAVAITGGIGAGKSEALASFGRQGAAVVSSDQIVHRLTATGTMTGEFMGIAPTGKSATWTEIHIGRGVNGRISEHWGLVDRLSMLTQLGIVPAPGRVAVTV